MKGLSARVGRVLPSETVRISGLVAEKRRQGIDVVSFAAGEPDFPTPEHVREAAKKALDEGKTRYVPAPGVPELREAVAKKHVEENGMAETRPEHVLVTPSKQAIAYAILATVDHGDEVLLPDPCWVSYDPLVRLAGGTPVYVPLDAEDGFRMRPEPVAEHITGKTKLVVMNSPSNPTGGMDLPADVRGVAELVQDHGLYLLSDEIYEHVRYGGAEHLSPASLPGMTDHTVTVNGLSKSFSMTGWRIGWAIASGELMKAMGKLQSHTITHPTSFAQYGALAALTGPKDFIAEMMVAFERRRRLVLDLLAEIPGVTCAEPRGAFYVFPDISGTGMDAMTFAERLLEEGDVGVTPGPAFGPGGEGHVRISYATSDERIREGLARMKRFVSQAG
ncbi:MAG: pyridoxal phosphate-dependent aminotransferase [Euryarchaeota archaeon]|nr:pyridoxal phosphate-dependent aminotransferase [Euryarchaeota archaeon]